MRILVTGASGIVGSEVCAQLEQAGIAPVKVTSRPDSRPGWVSWRIGAEPAPEAVRQQWDVVVHAAASTRWTMTRDEASAANVEPTREVLRLVDDGGHLVHVSTAYAGQRQADDGEFDGYRNGYEWSKAQCEDLVRARGGYTIVRPPLILGRRSDGVITKFSGPYTLLQTLVSGLAAVVVGSPAGFAEIAPVDQVAGSIVAAALRPRERPPVDVVAAGDRSLRLDQMVTLILETINAWRDGVGLAPVPRPPTLSLDRWHRFYLPLAREHLSPMQNEVVNLLGMFEAYTSMAEPFAPTTPVLDPAGVLVNSVRYWITRRPRLARRTPEPWSIVGAPEQR